LKQKCTSGFYSRGASTHCPQCKYFVKQMPDNLYFLIFHVISFRDHKNRKLLFKYPAIERESYDTYVYIAYNIMSVVCTNCVVEVPAGVFNCYCYRMSDALGDYLIYLSPGIGFIKWERIRYDYSQIWELESFNINSNNVIGHYHITELDEY